MAVKVVIFFAILAAAQAGFLHGNLHQSPALSYASSYSYPALPAVYKSYSAPLVYSAPYYNSYSTYSAPVYSSSYAYSAPVYKSYSAPLAYAAPVYKSYSAPLAYAAPVYKSYSAPLSYSYW